MSQNVEILAYIKCHGSITSREAMFELNCGRLASRVHELRMAGFPINKVMVYDRKPDGTPEKYARYFIGGYNG